MKGYRLVGLQTADPTIPIPDERGSRRYFSDTLERAKWWEELYFLHGMEDGWFPQYEIAMHNGYAIVEVEAEEVEEDSRSKKGPQGNDWIGRVISVQLVKVVRYPYPKFPFPQKTFWGKVKCFFGIHLPCKGRDEYDFTNDTLVKDRTCWICGKQIRQESNLSEDCTQKRKEAS